MRRRELKRVETKRGEVTSRRIFFWSPCGGVCGHQVLLYGDGADVRSHCLVRRLVWLTTKLLCVECVAVSTIAPVCHTKELCRIDLSQRSAMDMSSSVV